MQIKGGLTSQGARDDREDQIMDKGGLRDLKAGGRLK